MRENTIPNNLSSKHEVCFMIKSAFKVIDTCLWYLDSGCSRHMIGKLIHFLGFQICQQDSGIFLSQSKYAKNLVKKFGLESANSVRTPMSPNVKLTIDLLGKNVDSSLYRSMIDNLLCLTASRPDISYNVGVCARYQANPKESHMIALNRIIDRPRMY